MHFGGILKLVIEHVPNTDVVMETLCNLAVSHKCFSTNSIDLDIYFFDIIG